MLIYFHIFTALQDGDAQRRFRGKEGENITVGCKFYFSGNETFFCKGICEGTNILVQTSSRFSIRYEKRNIFSFDFLHVSITDLKPSDSGRYRCRSDETIDGTLYDDFYLVVTKGEFSGLNSDFRISDLQSHHLQTATHEDTNQ
uniref:Immunoglobulin subtype domain-containing protein n=1 Tax=Xiphophorus maculatus TaxID=8083 RepID=A0A3B5RCC5_XIPMA